MFRRGIVDPNDNIFKPYKGVKTGEIVDYYGLQLEVIEVKFNN